MRSPPPISTNDISPKPLRFQHSCHSGLDYVHMRCRNMTLTLRSVAKTFRMSRRAAIAALIHTELETARAVFVSLGLENNEVMPKDKRLVPKTANVFQSSILDQRSWQRLYIQNARVITLALCVDGTIELLRYQYIDGVAARYTQSCDPLSETTHGKTQTWV